MANISKIFSGRENRRILSSKYHRQGAQETCALSFWWWGRWLQSVAWFSSTFGFNMRWYIIRYIIKLQWQTGDIRGHWVRYIPQHWYSLVHESSSLILTNFCSCISCKASLKKRSNICRVFLCFLKIFIPFRYFLFFKFLLFPTRRLFQKVHSFLLYSLKEV